jgi:hypothetical protein
MRRGRYNPLLSLDCLSSKIIAGLRAYLGTLKLRPMLRMRKGLADPNDANADYFPVIESDDV